MAAQGAYESWLRLVDGKGILPGPAGDLAYGEALFDPNGGLLAFASPDEAKAAVRLREERAELSVFFRSRRGLGEEGAPMMLGYWRSWAPSVRSKRSTVPSPAATAALAGAPAPPLAGSVSCVTEGEPASAAVTKTRKAGSPNLDLAKF